MLARTTNKGINMEQEYRQINDKISEILSSSYMSSAGYGGHVSAAGRIMNSGAVNSPVAFSMILFSDSNQDMDNKYRMVFDLTDFADQNNFKAVWMPERHFHPFGGIYPNPAVLASALASRTKNVRLRSGAVVLPLHHPVEVVESWAMVDHISNGRVDMGFASGWNPNDFIISPHTYADLKNVWHERIVQVQKLWRGEKMSFVNGKGVDTEIQVYPKPLQEELNVWLVITKLDESFKYAGEQGYNVLTMLQGIDMDELGRKIQLYNQAREANGYPPGSGQVTLMLHTLIHEDIGQVEQAVREPFYKYIKSALTGHIQSIPEDKRPSEKELEKMVDYSYQRYFKTGALFGSVEDAKKVVEKAHSVGVTEIACLMDFGVDYALVKESLPYLQRLAGSMHIATEGKQRIGA